MATMKTGSPPPRQTEVAAFNQSQFGILETESSCTVPFPSRQRQVRNAKKNATIAKREALTKQLMKERAELQMKLELQADVVDEVQARMDAIRPTIEAQVQKRPVNGSGRVARNIASHNFELQKPFLPAIRMPSSRRYSVLVPNIP